MQCRFEDRLAGRALNLHDPVQRIEAGHASQLPQAWEAIEGARRAGYWVALLLDYELGEWLAPETTLPPPTGGAATCLAADDSPRLTGLVFERMTVETPWPAEKTVLTQPSENTPAHASEVAAPTSLEAANTADITIPQALATHI